MEKIEATDFNENMLELSWKWLHDPLIKKLIDAPEFTKEEQIKWFENLAGRSDYYIWGVGLKQQIIGVFGIKNIVGRTGEYFGYIGIKELWGKGYGQQMLEQAVMKCNELRLSSLWLKVLIENHIAINSYIKFGFLIYDQNKKYIFMKIKI